MLHLNPPPLESLLPEVLSSLCEAYDNVECELETCPDIKESPFSLQLSSMGCKISAVPSSVPTADACKKVNISDAKLLTTAHGFHIISDGKPTRVLRITLLNGSSPGATGKNWRTALADCMNKVMPSSKWELLCLELCNNVSDISLLKNVTHYEIVEGRSNEDRTIWIAPLSEILEVAPVQMEKAANGSVPEGRTINGTSSSVGLKDTKEPTVNAKSTNGTTVAGAVKDPTTEPKTVVKKKVIRRIPKKTPTTDGTATANGDATKVVKAANGEPVKKLVKKKVASSAEKSTSKENSPVVEEVNEDISSVAYVVKLGQVPAPDGVSLSASGGAEKVQPEKSAAAEKCDVKVPAVENKPPVKANGVLDRESLVNKSPSVSMSNKLENGHAEPAMTNGHAEPAVGNGHAEPAVGNGHAEPAVVNGHTASEVPVLNGYPEVNGHHAELPGENGVCDQRRDSEEKSVVSTLSDHASTLSDVDTIQESCKQTSKVGETSSDEDAMSFCSVRSIVENGDGAKTPTSVVPPVKIEPCPVLPTFSDSGTAALQRRGSAGTPDTGKTGVFTGFVSSFASNILGIRPTSSLSNSSTLVPSGSRSRLSSERDDFSLQDDLSISSTLSERFRSSRSELRHETDRFRSRSEIRASPFDRRISPIAEDEPEPRVRGMPQMPVIALQLVLKYCSYHEMGMLRRVHPHWDELCGQMLNGGYYALVQKADTLLADCQRRLANEAYLARPAQVLTNLQVHVLNPVDILRAAMDEGVLCFPYGLILDKTFDLLEKIEIAMQQPDADAVPLSWDKLADLARKAQYHYRRHVEPEAERRMTEVYKLSAAQRMQRLDSFLIESTVNKLENVTQKARDDLHWEVEQLKTQNTQLKKDNRELKSTCGKLESRIEALERKFKTMARVLQ